MKITLTRDQYKLLTHAVDDDVELRPGYAGRGMMDYGTGKFSTCLGYVGDNPCRFTFKLAVLLADEDGDLDGDGIGAIDAVGDWMDRIGTPSRDAMGMSTIYYWRNVSVEGGAELEEED
jgi:hypothetical protein